MLTKSMQDALNEQIKKELYSSYLYLSMSVHCGSTGLPGFASWMLLQAKEEASHALKLMVYIADRNGQVVLQAIAQPPTTFESPLIIFKEALAHEELVTASINDLYALAVKENDYATQSMLRWFIDEQVEEVKNAADIVGELTMVGEKGPALFMVDRQLAGRS